jgi:hypothetical protein
MPAKLKTLVLAGKDGNAFAILGRFIICARREGWTEEEIDAVVKKAKSGNYDHLVSTIMDQMEHPLTDGSDVEDEDE